MANGELITEIRRLTESKKKIPPTTRDRLMLAAIADLYGKVEKMYFTYQVLAGAGVLLGTVSAGILTMILTGQIEVVVK